MPRKKTSPPDDDLLAKLREQLQTITDRKKCKDTVWRELLLPRWKALHPDRPNDKGGAPKLSPQRVREAWEKVYRQLGVDAVLQLSWHELVERIKMTLGPITYISARRGKRTREGKFYSESAIRPQGTKT